MLTKMTEEDWEIVLEVFDAAQSGPAPVSWSAERLGSGYLI
jgi:hypothetical protein